ncbi:MAG TPA: histidine kinase [Chitinophagaceae bacterium]|nr:histidine kinase [Chitinophagaceae bacterium]
MAFQFYRKNLFHASTDEQLLNSWFITMNFITSGPPISCALFLTFKMLKNYYLKIEEKLALTKENANAELQLLKAQVHPHFLFNTLNNIYSFTLIKSQEAGTLVQKLSDTINYMINDCEARMVPLEKELEMLLNYATLEKVRYGDRLEMDIEINGNYHNKLVTPLLMIPFVENSFKHGTSQTLERPWIKLIICVEDNILHFDISNSKPVQSISPNLKNGIGLKNVQKRLQLLYHENHELKISSSSNTFSVRLKIPLEEPKLGETNTINQKEIFSEHQISIYG